MKSRKVCRSVGMVHYFILGGQGRSLWSFWAKTWKTREARTQRDLRKEHSRQREKEGEILDNCHHILFSKWHFCCIRKLSLFISVTPVICHIFWETLGEIISKLSLPWHSFILWLSPGKASICMQQRIWRKRSGYGPWPQDLPLRSFPKLCFSLCLLFSVKEQGPKHQTVLVLLFYHMLPSTWVISLLPQPSESREEEQKMETKKDWNTIPLAKCTVKSLQFQPLVSVSPWQCLILNEWP